jgi:hypothetical protein
MTRDQKKAKPREATRERMLPITRERFMRLLDKAIRTPATKTVPKST